MKVVFLTSLPNESVGAQWFLIRNAGENDIVYALPNHMGVQFPREYDFGISYFYNKLVPASEIANHFWINFHPAPLPEYGGRNVAYHAIMNGEKFFGATIHYMDGTFDTGDIIEVARFPILESHTAGDIAQMARDLCFELFKKYIPLFLAEQKPVGIKQRQTRYYKKQPISDTIVLTPAQKRMIRAVTAGTHVARANIGGRGYVIIPSECYHPDDGASDPVASNPDPVV